MSYAMSSIISLQDVECVWSNELIIISLLVLYLSPWLTLMTYFVQISAGSRIWRKGWRPRFWGLAPNIFGVIFCHFRGLFKVFGENKCVGGGGHPLHQTPPAPLDPPLQITYLISIISRQPSRCALQLLFGRRMCPRMVIPLSPISLVMWG